MISLDRLIEALGITDEADVPRLEEQRDSAIAYIETQTRRYFGPVTAHTEWYRGNGTRSLWLNESAVVDEDNTLTVNEYSYAGATAAAIVESASDGFTVRTHGPHMELLRTGSGGVWTRDYDYAVTYSRGYVENAGPKDIEDLLIEMVRLKWSSGGEETMKSETFSGYSYTRFDDVTLSDDAQATLDSWKRLVYA